nr:MAG TPA: hypothetical protein [Caudoviricetes sp.]
MFYLLSVTRKNGQQGYFFFNQNLNTQSLWCI